MKTLLKIALGVTGVLGLAFATTVCAGYSLARHNGHVSPRA